MSRLSGEQLHSLQQHWRFQSEPQFHRRVANFVYLARLDDTDVVLRVTEPAHRHPDEIVAEIDWMRFLAENGMRVAEPVPSVNGELVVQISGAERLTAVVFKKAPGGPLKEDFEFHDEFLRHWGRYLGRMHRLTKTYRVAQGVRPRQQWDRDESLTMAMRSFDARDEVPYRSLNETMDWMRQLPRDESCYGLVHCDLHHGNFFVENGELIAFDFDDACHQWFSYDMVIPLNTIEKIFEKNAAGIAQAQALFLGGYDAENRLAPIWKERLPAFRVYRSGLMYHWIKTAVRESVFDEKGLAWARERMPQLLDIMKMRVPYL